MRPIKSKLIHFKIEKYETSIQSFLKCNLSIIAIFESYLFKNNRDNYKQPNTMNIKKWIQEKGVQWTKCLSFLGRSAVGSPGSGHGLPMVGW